MLSYKHLKTFYITLYSTPYSNIIIILTTIRVVAAGAGCVDAKFAELLKIQNYASQLRNSGSYFVLKIPNELLIPFTVQN